MRPATQTSPKPTRTKAPAMDFNAAFEAAMIQMDPADPPITQTKFIQSFIGDTNSRRNRAFADLLAQAVRAGRLSTHVCNGRVTFQKKAITQ